MPAAATATRAAHAAPIGTGHLHQALEDARDLANLNAFCRALSCVPADVSADGIRLDILRVFDLMRTRGYGVDAPARSQIQSRKGSTTWVAKITLPNGGPTFVLGFYTPNTS